MTYSDGYGNDLTDGPDDLVAGAIRHALCRQCGVWYHWDAAHGLYFEGAGYCRRKELRG
jgi:hypothetical protein